MADNDNRDDEGKAGAGTRKVSAGGAGMQVIVQLASVRSDKDADNLEALLAETHDLASESLKYAKLEGYDSPVRDALVRQGNALVGCYTRLLAARERHRKAIKDADSDDAAHLFRSDRAHHSDLMPPR